MSKAKSTSLSPIKPPVANFEGLCCNCHIALASEIHIKCDECAELFFCLECFSLGAEIADHKKEHAYQVVGERSWKLFDSPLNWSVKEIKALLNAVIQHGYGHWKKILACLPTQRSVSECEQIIQVLMNGTTGNFIKQNAKCTNELTLIDLGAPPKSVVLHSPSSAMSSVCNVEQQRLLGYWPLRDEFELDYNPTAESGLSELVVPIPGNEDEDIKLFQLWRMQLYRLQKLKRIERKIVAKRYQLLSKACDMGSSYGPHLEPSLVHALQSIFPEMTAPSTPSSNLHDSPPKRAKTASRFSVRDSKSSTPTVSNTAQHLEVGPQLSKEQTFLQKLDSGFTDLKPLAQFTNQTTYYTMLCSLQKERDLIEKIKKLQNQRKTSTRKQATLKRSASSAIENGSGPLGKKLKTSDSESPSRSKLNATSNSSSNVPSSDSSKPVDHPKPAEMLSAAEAMLCQRYDVPPEHYLVGIKLKTIAKHQAKLFSTTGRNAMTGLRSRTVPSSFSDDPAQKTFLEFFKANRWVSS